MRLVIERGGLDFVVGLIFETFITDVHAVVGANTTLPRTTVKPGYSSGKTR